MISYKRRYPFLLGTTSFIYPADYVTNVEKIGHFLDEVELLLFESRRASRPDQAQIIRLQALAQELDIRYNVHLPSDLFLGDINPDERQNAVDCLAEILALVEPLSATTHTLHLMFAENDRLPATIAAWQSRTLQSLTELLSAAAIDPRRISIETLDYPPHWFAPMVRQLNLAVCLDVGHLIRYGFDLGQLLNDFGDKIAMVHLHGVVNGADHRSISALSAQTRQTLIPFLKTFHGSVSLEMFALDQLEDSLPSLSQMMTAGTP